MWNFCWACWFLWESFSTLDAHPASPKILTGSDDSCHREYYWLKYALGFFSITITVFTLVGCLCCNRNHRSNGFQEFKDERIADHKSTLQPSCVGLELEIPRSANIRGQVEFEPIRAEHFIRKSYVTHKPKPPSSPSAFEEETGETIQDSCREWSNTIDLHISREKLKYLREIGQGWFGKVVEGRADLKGLKVNDKIVDVVVRILSDEATTREKAWFLVEATPYFRLRHPNILALIGCCLETDPYLLIFDSCPFGDLKFFLRSNRDSPSREVLSQENMLTRMALDIGAGLQHMHNNGFAHTDLSARNCLVSTDLSVKLGDYGTGVEKYPLDYYVIGDQALPIRWSAPESLECSETTIETREITPCANIWSYAILLWEIITWGERPYDELDDEQVIQMLLSKSRLKSTSLQLLLERFAGFSCSILEVIRSCLDVDKNKRTPLEQASKILIKEHLRVQDFEYRWENSQPNTSKSRARSASLKDLRGSVDSEGWSNLIEEKFFSKHQTRLLMGPQELVKNIIGSNPQIPLRESDSETEEESWRVKVERGAYTEKVKQKSKSVTDLMILVHIDSDSDTSWSLGPQITQKSEKKKLTLFGSDGDLRSKTLANEFDQELKKIRDTSISSKFPKSIVDHEKTAVLNLSMNSDNANSLNNEFHQKFTKIKKCIFSLTTKIDSSFPFLNYVPERSATVKSEEFIESPYDTVVNDDIAHVHNNFSVENVPNAQSEVVDVILWNRAINSALEKKVFDSESGEKALMPLSSSSSSNHSIVYSEHWQVNKSINDVSNLSNVETKINPSLEKQNTPKNLFKPNDERSSDSSVRNKESCDEEESPHLLKLAPITSHDLEASSNKEEEKEHEEEQLRILFELDSILEAECYGSLNYPLYCSSIPTTCNNFCKQEKVGDKCYHHNIGVYKNEIEISNDYVTRDEIKSKKKSPSEIKASLVKSALNIATDEMFDTEAEPTVKKDNITNKSYALTMPDEQESNCINTSSLDKNCWIEKEENDGDSSTTSLHSNNSYVSSSLDEAFVTAIRNELREKLPHTQMAVIEFPELQNEDRSSISSEKDGNKWDYDDVQDLTDRISGVDISIRYNMYDTPLSPIFEERESNANSESLISKVESKDASVASKDSIPEEDLLLMVTDTSEEDKHEFLPENEYVNANRLQISINEDITIEQIDDFDRAHYYLNSEIAKTGEGHPLPSPEEKFQWQQYQCSLGLSLPDELQTQCDLISKSLVVENDWDSQEDEEDVGKEDGEDDEGNADIDGQADDEENSSSSEEFVYKQYNKSNPTTSDDGIQNLANQIEKERVQMEAGNQIVVEDNDENDDEDDEYEDDDDDEKEFTPSAWDANLAPHRSVLRSPDKTLKSNDDLDQKKSVWFKKQRYHCVYEYPKEAPACDKEDQVSVQWEPTTYADWEEMISKPRLHLYSLDDEITSRDEEFCVSSSNRPFQFETDDDTYVSQFFPGAGTENLYQYPVQGGHQEQQQINKEKEDEQEGLQNRQLGELRHTRDRLKLNLTTSNEITETTLCSTIRQNNNNNNNNNSKSDENQLHGVEDKCNDNSLQPVDSPKPNE